MEADRPIVLTPAALLRILRAFALRLGMEETFADAVSQVHLCIDDRHVAWDSFLRRNCGSCAKTPETCEIFNPGPQNIVGDETTPTEMRAAQMILIEGHRYERIPCPARKPAE